MIADDWTLVKQLFEGALSCPPAERAEWLIDACAGRDDIQLEVESLLTSHGRAGDFLDEPLLAQAAGSRVGQTIGHYRLTSLIGEGGMGAVYRAVRMDDFEQVVAIKLSKHAASEVLADQFRKERQILAGLDHPNIARLFDGGSTGDGLSYFVMELVEGKPLNRYCEEHPLSLRARMRLFREICSAVQYAHQRLTIHQDLKPGNILVTGSGVPKLLDFGIARVLTPAALESGLRTMSLAGAMTPEYASPEQVRMQPVTTATDVYSLGVILYQLIAMRLPYTFTSHAPREIEAVVCGTDPARPSEALPPAADRRARRAVAGDLDNIVLKALRKDPEKRYASAGELADDIQRFLDDLPVTARPPTFTYRVGKVVTRYKAAVAAAAFVVLALLLGLAGTLWQAHVARIERQHAEQRFREVRQLAESLLFEIHDSIEDLPGATAARKLVVAKALRYLDTLSREDRGDADLQTELGAAYLRIGSIQGLPGTSNLGDSTSAVVSYQKAVALFNNVLETRPGAPIPRRGLGNAYGDLGRVLISMRKNSEGMDALQQAFAVRRALYLQSPNDWETISGVGTSHWELGIASNVIGDHKASLAHRMEAVKLWEAVVRIHNTPGGRGSLALMYKTLAAEQVEQKDLESGLSNLGKALSIDEELRGGDPNNSSASMALATSYSEFGTALDSAGKPAQALEYYLKSVAIRAALVAVDPADKRTLGALASVRSSTALTLLELRRTTEALSYCNAALAIQERQVREDPENAYLRSQMAFTLGVLGETYVKLASAPGHRDRAAANWETARSFLERAVSVFRGLRQRGKLDPSSIRLANRFERQLSECNLRISRTR